MQSYIICFLTFSLCFLLLIYFLRNWAPGWLSEEFDVCLLPNRVLHVLWLQDTNQHQTLMTPFHERVLFQGRNPLGLEICLFVSPTTWRMLFYIGKKKSTTPNMYISLALSKMVYKLVCHVKPCTRTLFGIYLETNIKSSWDLKAALYCVM